MPVGDRYHDDREFRPLALMDSDGVGRHYLVEVREGIFYLSPVKFDTYLVVVIVDKRYEAYVAVEDILFVIVLYLHYLVAETVEGLAAAYAIAARIDGLLQGCIESRRADIALIHRREHLDVGRLQSVSLWDCNRE